MSERMYGELAAWWPLLSAPEDYAEEAALFLAELRAAARGEVGELLELGSGGGNTASHLKHELCVTLTDRSRSMVEVSTALNPECEHVLGDMRELELGRTFDAVLLHDAVMYLTTERDLRAALATAARHLRPGGVLLAVPDETAESWRPETSHGGHDGARRALRYLSWSYDPDPADTRTEVAYAMVLREEGEAPRVVHEVHEQGLFPRASWLAWMEEAGLEARARPFEHSEFPSDARKELFVGVRRD